MSDGGVRQFKLLQLLFFKFVSRVMVIALATDENTNAVSFLCG